MSRPLHVLIDGRMLLGRFSGVSRFVMSLARELVTFPQIRLSLLAGNLPIPADVDLSGIQIIQTPFSRAHRSRAKRFIWELTKLPAILRRIKPDVFHATWNTCGMPSVTIPMVLTIHDLIPLRPMPQSKGFSFSLNLAALKISFNRSVRQACSIATVSNFVRNETIRAFEPDPSKVQTIYHGTSLRNSPTDGLPHHDPFILYVGGHEPRKNIAALFEGLANYWKNYNSALALYITGSEEMLCPNARNAFSKLPPNAPVHFLGAPSDAELATLYSRAAAFVSLSLDEGFGFPVIEAMSCRCPVIVSDRASLPEIAGNAAIIVKPDQSAALADAIHRLTTCPQTRLGQIEAGLKRAAEFSWNAAAQQYLSLYRQAASLNNARTASHFKSPALASPATI